MLSNGKISHYVTKGENEVFFALYRASKLGSVNVDRAWLVNHLCESLNRPERGVKKALARLDYLGIIHGWEEGAYVNPEEIGISCESLQKTGLPLDTERRCPHRMCFCEYFHMGSPEYYQEREAKRAAARLAFKKSKGKEFLAMEPLK